MEGRWAKLTLYAHLHKFIDITKDIHPVIEHTIFNYIESTENLKTLAGYPLIDSEKDELYYVNKEWIKPYTSCIT